jgi:hypothetical protein
LEDLKVGLYIFGGVLVYGTLWRILSFHAMASPNTALQHLGKAMSVQY